MPIDKMNPAAAAGAYANIQKAVQGTGVSAESAPNFGDMVKKAALDSINTLHAGEKASAGAVTGKADLTDVVQAVTDAQTTLDTVIAIRDKMLNAYDEIMREAI
jgi:flagellar hook-basal body complex protein FliE